MPAKDGTGPRGEGPRTGRGFGNCNKDASSNQGNFGFGRGRCCRRGFEQGRSFGNRAEPVTENKESKE